MTIFPFEKYTISFPCDRKVLVQRLNQVVEEEMALRIPLLNDTSCIFEGKVDRNHFKINKIAFNYRALKVLLKGKFIECEDGTTELILIVRYSIVWLTILILVLAVLYSLAIKSFFNYKIEEGFSFLGMMSFIYAFFQLMYLLQANESKRNLLGCFFEKS